jgi:DNA-binding MarR family transcriptional regulator
MPPKKVLAREAQPEDDAEAAIDLRHFFPYRLAVLAESVSKTIAQLYADRFDLSRPAWRVLAALAIHREMTAKEIAEYSSLDKMSVSRAVAELESGGFLVPREHLGDRRNRPLQLTPQGRALYQKIVPLVRARETFLLEVLTPKERDTLQSMMDRLLERARSLQSRG